MGTKHACHPTVAVFINSNLGGPIALIDVYLGELAACGAPVPEAAIDKDREFLGRKKEVRTAKDAFRVKLPARDAGANEYHSELYLGALVGFAADRGHRSRALNWNVLKSTAGEIILEHFIHDVRLGGWDSPGILYVKRLVDGCWQEILRELSVLYKRFKGRQTLKEVGWQGCSRGSTLLPYPAISTDWVNSDWSAFNINDLWSKALPIFPGLCVETKLVVLFVIERLEHAVLKSHLVPGIDHAQGDMLLKVGPNPTSVLPGAISLRGDARHAPAPLHHWLPWRQVHIRAAISCSSGPMASA